MIVATLLLVLLAAEPDDSTAAADTKEAARRVLELAQKYEFFADPQSKTKVEMDAKPVLVYSNPVRGDVYGNVYVWTQEGRPALIGAFFDHRSEDRLTSELHALTKGGMVGRRDGETFWSPEGPGITFEPLKVAPAPAANASSRGRQMRELARRFTVERDHPEQGKGEVRLLPQPVYRYAARTDGIMTGRSSPLLKAPTPRPSCSWKPRLRKGRSGGSRLRG